MWESGPGTQASGPRDPRLGLRKFSASARMRRVGPSRALDPMHGASRPAGPTTDDRRPTEDRGPGPLTAAELSGRGSRSPQHRPRDLGIQGLDLENFRPGRRCGESVRRGPLTPCLGLRDPRDRRPTTGDRPRTGTSDRGRTLRTWESGPGAEASGPQDPRVGPGTFSASARRPVPRPGPSTKYRADGVDLGLTWELPSAGPAGA